MRIESLEERRLLTTFMVDTPFDIVNPDDGLTSLREAIALAEDEATHPGHDKIVFDSSLRFATLHADIIGFDEAGAPVFDTEPGSGLPGTQPVPIIKGQFEISTSVTIDASGVDLVRIGHGRGFSQSHRILKVNDGAHVELVNAVIQGGDAFFSSTNPEKADGGGIWNGGTLTLRNVVVGGNVTTSAIGGGDVYIDDFDPGLGGTAQNVKFRGGGIFNAPTGNLTLVNSHIGEITLNEEFLQDIGVDGELFLRTEQREYERFTTAVLTLDPSLTINNPGVTRVSGNVSWGDGGGIYNAGTLAVTEGSVVAGNRVTGDGAGIYNVGSAIILDSMIRDHESLVAMASPEYVASLAGGGVYNADGAELIVQDSSFLRNVALTGGGIHNEGRLEIVGTRFDGNQTQSYTGAAAGIVPQGGTIFDAGERTIVTSSSFSGSSAQDGGAIFLASNLDANFDTVTISHNNVGGLGGGIHVSATSSLKLNNSTVTKNGAGVMGGGVNVADGGSIELAGTILGDNLPVAAAPDFAINLQAANFVSGGSNLIESIEGNDLSTNELAVSDLVGLDPRLGPLGLFGGNTLTHGLLPDSPALDSYFAVVGPQPAPFVEVDQRGEPRFVGPARDRGAFESQPLTTMRVDTLDGTADGFYAPGAVSLADAVLWANAVPGADSIAFAPELVEMLRSLDTIQTIELSAPLSIAEDLTILGPGADLVTVSAGNQHRVVETATGVDAAIRGLTISDGLALGAAGGAIMSRGNLLLKEVVVTNSSADIGGGIFQLSGGTLHIVRSTIHDNTAAIRGGGISSTSAQVRIDNSTISGNVSAFRGGGVLVDRGSLELRSTTIAANRVESNLTLTVGGGIHLEGNAQMVSESSLLAGNILSKRGVDGPNDVTINGFGATAISTGHNLFGQVIELVGTFSPDASDQVDVADPLIGVLSHLGGPTPVHGLLPGSPAIDAVPIDVAPTTDQRGVARPVGPLSDIGALEAQPPSLTNPLVVDTLSGESDGFFGPGGLSLDEAVLLLNDQSGTDLDQIQFDPALFNAARAKGVTISVSTSAPDSSASAALDGDPATSWLAAPGDTKTLGGDPFFEVNLPKANTLTGLRLTDTSIRRGLAELFSANGTLLQAVEFEELDPFGNVDVSFRSEEGLGTAGVTRVRLTSLDDGIVTPRIAEFDLVGDVVEIVLPARTLQLANHVTIVGPGADRLRVSGGDQRRVFEVLPNVAVNMAGITIADGFEQNESGGGVLNRGDLGLSEVFVTNSGGGVRNDLGATLTIERSTIAGNSVSSNGGGIDNSGELMIVNTTISGNFAFAGGGIRNEGVAHIQFSTIVGNAAELAGGIRNEAGGSLRIGSTILANSVGDDGQNFGVATSDGFNLIGVNDGFLNPATGDQFGSGQEIDPQLTDLLLVGGPTPVHALLPGSPAEEAGNPDEFPSTDQRGVFRPQVSQPDIGAFESKRIIVGSELVVGSLSDVLNGDYAPHNLTLREAVLLANLPNEPGITGPQTIRFSAQVIQEILESDAGSVTIALTEGPLRFSDDIVVRPFDAGSEVEPFRRDLITIDAQQSSRVVEVDASTRVELFNLTLTGGSTFFDGGGVLNQGDLLLRDVTVAGNVAGGGGGVRNDVNATLIVDRSVIANNAADQGGGLQNLGDATILRSSIIRNPGKQGGGVWSNATLRIEVSTISSNGVATGLTASDRGGGVFIAAGDATISDSTIANNQAASAGGLLNRGQLTLSGTIIAGNLRGTGAADDAVNEGVLVASAFNLIGDNAMGFVPDNGSNQYTADAMLGPLADNGGPTPTHSLLLESPALDAGDPLSVRLFDQRGLPLADVPGGTAIADMGAFERQRIVRSEWRYEALGQSQFGPGEATVIGFGFDDGRQGGSVDPDPYFLGFEFDTGPLTYGSIANGPFGTRFGGELKADFAGRFGFDIGYYVNSGSVDVTYDGAMNYVVETGSSGMSAEISAFVDVNGGSFYTVSPKIGAYADLVLELDARISATACLFGCVGGNLLNLNIDESPNLLSLNRQVEDDNGRAVFLTAEGNPVAQNAQTGQFFDLDGQPIENPGPITPLLDGDIRLFGVALEDLGIGRISNQAGRDLLERARSGQNAAGQIDSAQKVLANATNDRDRLDQQLADAERRLANAASSADATAAQSEIARLAGADYAAAAAAGDQRPPKEGVIGSADDARTAAAQNRDAATSKLSRDRTGPSSIRTPGLGFVFDVGGVEGNLLGAEIGVGVGASAGLLGAVSRNVGSLSVSLPDVNLRDTSVGSNGRLTASTDAFPAGSLLDANRQIAKAQVDLAALLPLGPIPTGSFNASLGPISLDVTTVSYDVGPELNVTQDVQIDPIIVDQGVTYRFYDPALFDPADPLAGALSFEVDVNGSPVGGGVAVHSVTFNPGDKVTVRGDGTPVLVQPSLAVDARVSNDIGLEVDLDGVFEAFAVKLQAFGASIVDIGPLIRHAHTLATLEIGEVLDRTFDLGQSILSLAPFTLFEDIVPRDGRTAGTALRAEPTTTPDLAVIQDAAVTAEMPLWIAAELFDPTNPDELKTTIDVTVTGPAVASLTAFDEGVTVTHNGPLEFSISGYDVSLLRERSSALFALTFEDAGQVDITVQRSAPMMVVDVPEATENLGKIVQSDFDGVGVSALLTTDIDGDGLGLPSTDGELLIRHLSGATGDALVTGALGDNATRTTGDAITNYIEGVLRQTLQIRDPVTGRVVRRDTLDFDGSGNEPTAEVDGILFQRYLAGLRGADLIADLATSASGEEVVTFIERGRSSANNVNAAQLDEAVNRVGADVFGLDGVLDADRQDGSSAAGAVGPNSSLTAKLGAPEVGAAMPLIFEMTTYGQSVMFEEVYLDGELVSRVAEGSPTNFGSEAYADLLLSGVDSSRLTRETGVARLGIDEPLFLRSPDAAGYEYRAQDGFLITRLVIDPQVKGNQLLPGDFDLYLFDDAQDQWVFSTLISVSNPAQVAPHDLLVYDFEGSGVPAFRLFSHDLPNLELHDADNSAAPVFESIVGFELEATDGSPPPTPTLILTPLEQRDLYDDVAPLIAMPVFASGATPAQTEFLLRRLGSDVERSVNGSPIDLVRMGSAPTLVVLGSDLAEDTLTISSSGGPIRTPIVFKGGFRIDTLRVDPTEGAGLMIDLVARDTIAEVEVIDLRGSGANTLRVNRDALNANDPFMQTLTVRGNADDLVFAEAGWVLESTVTVDFVTYDRYILGDTVLLVEATATFVSDLVIDADFNNDGVLDGDDIDSLQANLVNGPADPLTFDLTGDGLVTIADRDAWLAQAGAINLASGSPYLLGDANLDGLIDVDDFDRWNSFKFTATSAWTAGDFNADGAVDVSDFNLWNMNKFIFTDAAPARPVDKVAQHHEKTGFGFDAFADVWPRNEVTEGSSLERLEPHVPAAGVRNDRPLVIANVERPSDAEQYELWDRLFEIWP